MKNLFRLILAASAATSCMHVAAQSGLVVEVGPTRGPDAAMQVADHAAQQYLGNLARLGAKLMRDRQAAQGKALVPFVAPVYVRLTSNGVPLKNNTSRDGGDDIQIAFDDSGVRAFPTAYRALLESTFAKALPTMNAVFGKPSKATTIKVSNYDLDISDRDAVAGGYFVPSNGVQPEIRIPVYNSPEAAAVNFIHCLLLAYLGEKPYPFDALNEGLVRAAVTKIARIAGAMPADLSPEVIETVLENSYDIGAFYDWYNQRALGGPQFVAPNLRSAPLPIGGSLGGIFLLRFHMAGSCWSKVLIEHPGFVAAFNQAYYANPGQYQTTEAWTALAQSTLNSLAGNGATVEGLSFPSWSERQFILDTRLSTGLHLLNQPFPITFDLGGSDFGVFGVQAMYFETLPTGDEILLSGTCYPIFWDPDFLRIFPSTQDEQMDISGAYGSVAPNFPGDLFGGDIYRVAADLPVQDQMARVYLPAGAIATVSNPDPNNLYGTVIGADSGPGISHRIRVSWGTEVVDGIPLIRGAFGSKIQIASYLLEQRVLVEVIRKAGDSESVVLSRRVNKSPGSLALDLRIGGDQTYVMPNGLVKGIATYGFPVEPYRSHPSDVLGLPAASLQIARWNPAKSKYDLFPQAESFTLGHGYFVRADAAKGLLQVRGTSHPDTPMSVALRPGWNLIANPTSNTVSASSLQVIVARDSPMAYSDAVGTALGAEIFSFSPGATDPITGAPEAGTMTASTSFEPGKAYYVRVLAPEGATLLFGSTTRSRSLGRPDRGGLTNGWKLRVQLAGGKETTEAFVGQTRQATSNFDSKFDSGLPPLFGGLQASIGGREPLYCDMRMLGRAATYKLQFRGLRKGKSYLLTIGPAIGFTPPFALKDSSTGKVRQYSKSARYFFIAQSDQASFEVSVP